MGPPLEPSGVGTPDLGWQQSGRRGRAAAARTSTTPAETLAGTQASPRQVMKHLKNFGYPPTPAHYLPYPYQLSAPTDTYSAPALSRREPIVTGQRDVGIF